MMHTMHWFRSLITGIRSLLQPHRVEQDLEEELELYFEQSVAHHEGLGMTPEEGRRAARIAIGSRNAVKHQVWNSRWESAIANLAADVRLGVRSLLRTPGFTAVAVLSLALGIGANTALFTLFNAVLLRPLPVAAPQQLVLFGEGVAAGSTDGMPSGSWQLFSYPLYRAFAAQPNAYSGVAAISSMQFGSHLATGNHEAEPVKIDLVSGSYFQVLGVPPALGRVLSESDDRAAGAGSVAVASYGWFERHSGSNAGGSRSAIGSVIRIQGHDYTLIGVAQPGFTGLTPSAPTDLWIPLSMEKEISPGWNGLENTRFESLYLVGRLRPGVTRSQATESTNLLFRQIIRNQFLGDHPTPQNLQKLQQARIELTSIRTGMPNLKQRLGTPLVILMSIVGLVLLMACANIANMLLARGVARVREIAVRQAIGATRARIVALLLTESCLLAITGAGLGMLIAWRGSHLLLAMASPEQVALQLDISPDLRVLTFTLLVTAFTALLFGTLPALRATRFELAPALKDGRGASATHTRRSLSRGLIVGQIALSVLLLVAAGLFLRSLVNLHRVDLGFDPKHATVFELDENSANLPQDARLTQMHQQVEQNVQALPGVDAASFAMFAFDQGGWSSLLQMQGVPSTDQSSMGARFNVVGSDYLKTFAIPLLSGRNFTRQDTDHSPHVALVNETLARTFFPNRSPIGHHFCLCGPGDGKSGRFDIEIIGVVRNAHYESMGEPQRMAAYLPYTQQVQYFNNFVVRSSQPLATLVPAVKKAIAAANPQVVVSSVVPLEDIVSTSVKTQRLIGMLSAFFAALAVFLAAIGLYGLISYSVARRTNEIGIRIALGSRMSLIAWLILRESLLLLAAGLTVGLPAALLAAHSLSAFLNPMLYKVSILSPLPFVLAATIACTMTFCAACIPARRAATINPIDALRSE